jgi:hypothetical protein
MKALRRLCAFGERLEHACDLYRRYGYSWAQAWNVAGTWQ